MGEVSKLRQIFSVPHFFRSSITDSKANRICKLNCFLVNTRSIVNKKSELEEYVSKYNPDDMVSES